MALGMGKYCVFCLSQDGVIVQQTTVIERKM